ncbi:GntR family transcriptional regulator [Bosea sp. (in: a-proteobacteria)]|jgi:DNA-binding GntR family transcriptional regulator|uniref:GntR family transcriptional regulator n=1 Tax=Bosea sp. (in: a-proteobacteria) TaxID=1871050 RepID=UPI003F6EDB0F
MSAKPAQPVPASKQPGRKGRLHTNTVDALHRMIVTGELPPGQKLREQELCDRLGVSRTPLREALRTLAAQGLVRLTQNRGAEVAPLTLSDIVALFDVVGTLEALAARLACKTMPDEAIAEVGVLHYRMMLHHVRDELPEYFALNQQIHRAVVEAAENPVLLGVWETLAARVERAKYLPNLQPNRWKAAMHEHDAMLAALVARDGEALGRLIEAHFANGLAAILAANREEPAQATAAQAERD